MIEVFFRVEDLVASAKFKADVFKIYDSGRLGLIGGDEIVAMFEAGVWLYVCQIESEVISETHVVTIPGNAKVDKIQGR